ncbi:Protein kinase domain-containing protein [Aphelenchoides besseyi]|nr:Protein kinase domain-containing protein [Aphelenchoides besseyi]
MSKGEDQLNADPVECLEVARKLAFLQARLSKNSVIRANDQEYQISRQVAVGAFGFTYEVKQKNATATYFLRTEPMTANPQLRKFKLLKIELFILRKTKEMERSSTCHFPRLVDSGCTDEFKFLITQPLGENLYDLTRNRLGRAFTPSTALRVSIQILRGLQDLHSIGFLHRFIRPHAFAIGLSSKIRTVYFVDFGIPWMFRDSETQKLKRPRKFLRMLGSLRYISHNMHANKEQARRDDIESWIYLSMELFDLNALPWRNEQLSTNVLHKKKKCIDGHYSMAFTSSSLHFKDLLDYVVNMKFQERPDYAHISQVLQKIRAERNLNFDLPYDWELLTNQMSMKPTETRSSLVESKSVEKKKIDVKLTTSDSHSQPVLVSSSSTSQMKTMVDKMVDVDMLSECNNGAEAISHQSHSKNKNSSQSSTSLDYSEQQSTM